MMRLNKKIDWERILLFLIFSVFLFQAIFFAIYLSKFLPPDEGYHYYVSLAYSKVIWIPSNTTTTFLFGDITRIPYLYYWLNGRFTNFSNLFGLDILLTLRLVGTFYSFLTLIFLWLASKEVVKEKFFRLLPVFMLSTTMMFNFLGGAVSYDNLVNLLAVASIFFLLKLLKKDFSKPFYLFSLVITLLLISLTKFTALPLVLIMSLIITYKVIKDRVWNLNLKNKRIYFAIFLIIGFLLLGNIFLYGENYLRYKQLIPSCEKIMTHEECSENFLYNRNFEYEAAGIASRGGKRIRDLLFEDQRMNPFDFIFEWERKITPRLYGVFSGRSVIFPRNYQFVYTLLFFILLIPLIRNINKKHIEIYALLTILIFYSWFIIYPLHYISYLKMNSLNIAMQGRYLLPVVPIAYILQTWALEKIRVYTVRIGLSLLLLLTFLLGNLYIFYNMLVSYNQWFV
jgi:hypothetical protein